MPPVTPRPVDTSDPTFSPSSLRVVDLRALLSGHGVVLPSSARKADLVDAVEEHILTPQRAARSKTRPAAKRDEADDDDDDAEEAANFSHENPFQASPSLLAANKKQQPRKSTPATATSRSSSSSQAVPQQRRKTMDPSAFNGTSRSASSRVASSSSVKTQRSPPTSPTFEDYIDPSIAAAAAARSSNGHAKSDKDEDRKASPAGPRTSSLVAARRKTARKLSITRPHPRKDVAGVAAATSRYVAVLFILLSYLWYTRQTHTIGYCDTASTTNPALTQRQREQELRRLHDDQTLLDLVVPEFVQPSCTPCPSHGRCDQGQLLACESDEYVMRSSLLSRLPLPIPHAWQSSACRTDSRRLEMIDELADEIFRRVAEHVGGVICGNRQPSRSVVGKVGGGSKASGAGAPEWRRGLLASELHAQLRSAAREADVVTDEYFDHLWEAALQELRDEHIEHAHDANSTPAWLTMPLGGGGGDDDASAHDSIMLVSATSAHLPLTCRARLSFASFLRRISGPVGGLVALLSGLAWLRSRIRRSRSEARLVESLVEEVTQRLAQQALESALAADDGEVPPYLPVGQLRDSLLASSGLRRARRRDVWGAVVKRVEANSNVRTAMKRWRSEWMRVWEWVGVVGGGGGGSRPATPRSSRSSRPSSAKPQEQQQLEDGNNGDASIVEVAAAADEEQPEMVEKVDGKARM